MDFYVIFGETDRPKVQVLRRIQAHYNVALVQERGHGPVLYDGVAYTGEVERRLGTHRICEHARSGRLVCVVTTDLRVAGHLTANGARLVTAAQLHEALDQRNVAPYTPHHQPEIPGMRA